VARADDATRRDTCTHHIGGENHLFNRASEYEYN
jgi:hypothetical protein